MAEKTTARYHTKAPQADRQAIVFVLSAMACSLLAISILQFHILNRLQRDLAEMQQELSMLAAACLKRHHVTDVTFHSTRRRRSSPGEENNSTCFQCIEDIHYHLAKIERRRRRDEERYKKTLQRKLSELGWKVKPLERKCRLLSRKVDTISSKFNHEVGRNVFL